MNSSRSLLIVIMALLMSLASVASAKTVQTKVSVHVISKGAKFIGDAVGGARVTIHNAETGRTLSQGITSGGSGNTDRVMRSKHGHSGVLSTPDAADFNTPLWLEEPTTIRVTAYGPLAHEDDANTATITTKVLPGEDLSGGDGLLLEIPGFVVDITRPESNWFHGESARVSFRARVTMMCGCPIVPDGLWDANEYDISVKLYRDEKMVGEFPMSYAGEPSTFKTTVRLPEPGCYRAVVQAYDPSSGNTGYESLSCHLMK